MRAGCKGAAGAAPGRASQERGAPATACGRAAPRQARASSPACGAVHFTPAPTLAAARTRALTLVRPVPPRSRHTADEPLEANRVYRTTYMFSATMPPAVERLARCAALGAA